MSLNLFRERYRLLAGVSAAALFVGAPLAFAQSSDSTAVPVQGGEVIVEQEDATVDVTVPEPEVEVTQGQPVVTVTQPQPEITVVVPEPTVRVRQQAPIITVEQAQPEITVRIPEPVITVMVPEPAVDVETGEPIIDLDQPEPVVRFERPEPRITIQEGQPQIEFEQGEAEVNVASAADPNVTVEQEEAAVNIEQADNANVQMTTEDPEVEIVEADGADINVTQAEARVIMEDFNADAQGNMAEADRTRYNESVATLPVFDRRAEELVGLSVATEGGDEVGEIDNIGRRGDTIVAIIGVGGFLGLGENDIAVPVERLLFRDNLVIVPQVTESELNAMPEYNESEVTMLRSNDRLADAINM
ncbi:MAG: PRC-barrel domain-containing protein [Paracoccaceae bacterium]